METTETLREPRRLVRPRDRRWLGGVAGGLGAYFDLSPTIYRIAFVALALAGGTGVLLYLAAWLVIPEDGAAGSIAPRGLAEARAPARASWRSPAPGRGPSSASRSSGSQQSSFSPSRTSGRAPATSGWRSCSGS